MTSWTSHRAARCSARQPARTCCQTRPRTRPFWASSAPRRSRCSSSPTQRRSCPATTPPRWRRCWAWPPTLAHGQIRRAACFGARCPPKQVPQSALHPAKSVDGDWAWPPALALAQLRSGRSLGKGSPVWFWRAVSSERSPACSWPLGLDMLRGWPSTLQRPCNAGAASGS